MRNQVILGAALISMAACSVGDTDDDPFAGVDLPSGPSGYVSLAKEAYLLGDKLDGISTTTIPGGGTARYDGVLLLTDDVDAPTENYTGDLSAVADFDRATLSGSAKGFYYATGDGTGRGTSVPGTLSITSADTSVPIFDIDITGTVDLSNVDGQAAGFFQGRNADMLAGIGDDSVSVGTADWDVLILGD